MADTGEAAAHHPSTSYQWATALATPSKSQQSPPPQQRRHANSTPAPLRDDVDTHTDRFLSSAPRSTDYLHKDNTTLSFPQLLRSHYCSFLHSSSFDSLLSTMSTTKRNLAVVYEGPEKVAVKDIGYPQFKDPQGNPAPHAVIVKVSQAAASTIRCCCCC